MRFTLPDLDYDMSEVKEALSKIESACAKRLRKNAEIQEVLQPLWREAREESERFPPSYLLVVFSRLEGLARSSKLSAARSACLLQLKKSDRLDTEDERTKAKEYAADPLLRAHYNQVDKESTVDSTSRSFDQLESDLLEAVKKHLVDDAALLTAWQGAWNVAWQSSAADMDMPPFKPRENRMEKVRHIARKVKDPDTQFATSLQRLVQLNRRNENLPIAPVAQLMRRNYLDYFADLQAAHSTRASEQRNRFIRLAERSEDELVRRGNEVLRRLIDRHNAKVLSTINSELSLSSPAFSKLLTTDFGSEWVLDSEPDEGTDLRASLREEMQKLFLAMGCFWDVFEALKEKGDPKYARREAAPKTVQIATSTQEKHLKEAFNTLKQESNLQYASQEEWRSALAGNTTGDAVIKGIVSLACNCYGVERKGALPDRYLGFKGGGFTLLIKDLFYGRFDS